ncbi:hypothetical protein [Bacillus sp. AFS076308]
MSIMILSTRVLPWMEAMMRGIHSLKKKCSFSKSWPQRFFS